MRDARVLRDQDELRAEQGARCRLALGAGEPACAWSTAAGQHDDAGSGDADTVTPIRRRPAPHRWDAGDLACGELVLELRAPPGHVARRYHKGDGHRSGCTRGHPRMVPLTGHVLFTLATRIIIDARRVEMLGVLRAHPRQERYRQGHCRLRHRQRRARLDKDTLVFLSTEGVRLAVRGYADDIHEASFAPLKELMTNFAAAGGKIYVCSPCFKKRGLDESWLVAGATIVGGAKLVEFLSSGSPSVSY
jgi:predicted peroxiredoxin